MMKKNNKFKKNQKNNNRFQMKVIKTKIRLKFKKNKLYKNKMNNFKKK